MDQELLRIMEFAVGGADMAEYLPLLEEELAYRRTIGSGARGAWIGDVDAMNNDSPIDLVTGAFSYSGRIASTRAGSRPSPIGRTSTR